ncbi:MAG: GNAT family N-acetyltransferase [Treponema sp.]|nr:GNAT family N-acetyltransferase [Treponema sp.]
MIIRPASKKDIEAIMAIEEQSFISKIQETKDTFLERIEAFQDGFLLLENENTNEIAGYFASELWAEYPENDNIFRLGHSAKKTHDNNGSILYISSFAILPAYRSKGTGKSFFNRAINKIIKEKNIKAITLIVNTIWKNAISIYEGNGFETVRTIKDFFPAENGKATDALYMKKELTGEISK